MSASGVPRRHQTDWPVLFSPHSRPASGSAASRAAAVGLRPVDVRVGAQRGERRGAVAAGADHLDARERQVALRADAGVRALGAGEPAVAHDDDLVPDARVRPRAAGAAAASRATQMGSRPADHRPLGSTVRGGA